LYCIVLTTEKRAESRNLKENGLFVWCKDRIPWCNGANMLSRSCFFHLYCTIVISVSCQEQKNTTPYSWKLRVKVQAQFCFSLYCLTNRSLKSVLWKKYRPPWRDKSAWHLLLSWSCLAIIVFNKFQLFLGTWMWRLYMYYVNPKIVDTFMKLWKNRRQTIWEKMPNGTFTVCLFTFPKIWLVR